ncbi:MAG: hypothetical protein LBN27_05060 [Prevotellaceae bacterium]|jgi:hypothetical protein|nr:hypothetical protein [Prevotellaceae bacterium]
MAGAIRRRANNLFGIYDQTTLYQFLSTGVPANTTGILMNDIDCSGMTFSSLYNYISKNVVFEGNGLKLLNLTSNIFNGTIYFRRVQLIDVNIVTSSATLNYINNKMEQVYFQGSITSTGTATGRIGAIASGLQTENMVMNCLVDANISTAGTVRGGLVVGDGYPPNLCIAKGNVNSKNVAGGIIGLDYIPSTPSVNVCLATSIKGNDTYVGRCRGGYAANNNNVKMYCLETTLLNGNAVSESNNLSKNGANITAVQSRTQSFYEGLGYDFVDVWKMSSAGSSHGGTPILQFMEDI